jgi:hypothetical protein
MDAEAEGASIECRKMAGAISGASVTCLGAWSAIIVCLGCGLYGFSLFAPTGEPRAAETLHGTGAGLGSVN